MPGKTGRERLGDVCRWIALISLILFVLGCFLSWFVFSLIVWFAFWLSIFHWALARWVEITRAHIRLIDYPYLFAGAVAIFLLAASNPDVRERSLTELDDLQAPPTRAGLRRLMETSDREYCKIANQAVRPISFCNWLTRVNRDLADDKYTATQLQQLLRQSEQLADQEKWGTEPHFKTVRRTTPSGDFIEYPREVEEWLAKNNNTHLAGRTGRIVIRSMQKVLAGERSSANKPIEPKHLDPQSVRARAIYALLWPFIFALALALRLTKTTAEVTQWPKEIVKG